MLQDIGSVELRYVAEKLGLNYLSKTTSTPKFPIKGIIYGRGTYRAMVNLIVERETTKINVIFLIDTASPFTYLSQTTISALEMNDSIPQKLTMVSLHGLQDFPVQLSPADSHFSQVNVLGQNFFYETGVDFFQNVKTGEILLDYPKSAQWPGKEN